MNWFAVLTIVFIVISVALVLVVLVQRPQGGGLAGAFGGAGGGGADTVFGGRVGDALTWATTIIFIVFLLIAIGLNWLDQDSTGTVTQSAADSATGIGEPAASDTRNTGGGDEDSADDADANDDEVNPIEIPEPLADELTTPDNDTPGENVEDVIDDAAENADDLIDDVLDGEDG